ncbi:MAG: ABC transporter substrate-binding protein [Pseudomonadota bacterium]
MPETRVSIRRHILLTTSALTFALSAIANAQAADDVLKLGALGVMSGPYAGWGGVMSQTAQTLAAIYNDQGGIEIGDRTYSIEVISVDTKADPRTAVTGAERLVNEDSVKFILGPNVDTTAASVKPVLEAANAMNVPYAFSKDLYTPPASNSILGMVASYQVAPFIYEYLRDNEGVQKISFLAANAADPLNQRAEALPIAEALGLEIVASDDTYEPGATDFFPIVTKVLSAEPDLIVLSGVSPSDAGPLIRTARELGYEGFLSTETGQDPSAIYEVAGDAANGFIAAGGASTESIRSDFMVEFIERYTDMWGEWNDVAALFVYAPEIILQTLKAAGPEAIDDVDVFKTALEDFDGSNPFVNNDMALSYVGEVDFGQKRQISVPIVVQTIEEGEFTPLFVTSMAE